MCEESRKNDICALVFKAGDLLSRNSNYEEKWNVLKELMSCFTNEGISGRSKRHEKFRTYSYGFLIALLESLNQSSFYETWQEDLFDKFFLCTINEDSFMVLTRILADTSPSFKQHKILNILEKFLKGDNMHQMILDQCISDQVACDAKLAKNVIWDDLITLMVSLPERVANKMKINKVEKTFVPDNYIQILLSSILEVLHHVYKRLTNSENCCLEFVCRLIGRMCTTGYADATMKYLGKHLIGYTSKDFIWRRISHRIFVGIPGSHVEAVVTPLLMHLSGYCQVEWLLGDGILANQKLNYLLTKKLILIRQFKNHNILQNIIGYLAHAPSRRHLFHKVVDIVLNTWADGSALKHQAYSQHFYLTAAVMVCAKHLKKIGINNYKQALLSTLLHGIQVHISNSQPPIRTLGMVVGETLSAIMDPEGPQMKFEYEKTDEVDHLLSLLVESEDSIIIMESKDIDSSNLLSAETCKSDSINENVPEVQYKKESKDTEELDSDDDLEPFDLSCDDPLTVKKYPLYLRDCMQGLIEQDKPEWTEACLQQVEKLIKEKPGNLQEICLELAKVMLHLDNTFAIKEFVGLRYKALVALTVHCPVQIAEYLTAQFYDRNYNIRQRLDILEVLAAASQELSRNENINTKSEEKTAFHAFSPSSTEQHWKEIVQKRIESKTRRFSKGVKKYVSKENRFAAVAGYFFFPLMKHYDRKENTFDLLGEDSYILGRLIYTLGIIMNSAANISLARQMGASLLEFIWALRYHSEPFVRQSLIFSLCMVIINVPPYLLLSDLQNEVFESQQWLQDVIEKDADPECCKRAAQVLSLLLSIMKEELAKKK